MSASYLLFSYTLFFLSDYAITCTNWCKVSSSHAHLGDLPCTTFSVSDFDPFPFIDFYYVYKSIDPELVRIILHLKKEINFSKMVYDDERMLVVSILLSPLPYFHLFLFFFALAAGRKAL